MGGTRAAIRSGPRPRYRLAALVIGLCLCTVLTLASAWAGEPIRIGLTPVFLDDQVSLLQRWRGYLEEHLGRPVRFVQRTTYSEINDLLARGRVDAAWICGAPYLRQRDVVDLLAVPVFHGEPRYRSYLIVPADDNRTQGWTDLRGKVFAYSDPDSNSGSLYPKTVMRQKGLDPDRLFRTSFFAWGHRNVVEAVASGLAGAGAVDGYVWETLRRFEPGLTAQTRVVERSREFGFPPLVIREGVAESTRDALRRVLIRMGDEERGRALLDALNLDGFTRGSPQLYQGIGDMIRAEGPQ
ncbi:PhnD/SsuA/transferrin family substrate-binding protein [Ectothiorhodospiraceae bacterium WFHF3C12]|nr:PhnD/SsuA/transferrin family substrate-binding protein [Ectothiorhodospiraceae bacterium WFHF3C12]